MKALSVRQPWAELIVTGQKDIENRNWPIGRQSRHGGYSSQRANFSIILPSRICIHAGKREDKGAYEWLRQLRYQLKLPLAFGALVGEVDIVDCVTESESRWFTGPYGFVLTNPKAYEKPIPYKGQLGLFEVIEGRA